MIRRQDNGYIRRVNSLVEASRRSCLLLLVQFAMSWTPADIDYVAEVTGTSKEQAQGLLEAGGSREVRHTFVAVDVALESG